MAPAKRALVPVVALLVLAALAPGAAATPELSCTFRGPTYPALGRSKPGTLYVVFVRRALTCDEARSIALRGARTTNPGFLRGFRVSGGWDACLSWAPATASRVIAGQCVKPGSRGLVNWSPVCDKSQPACKGLRRG